MTARTLLQLQKDRETTETIRDALDQTDHVETVSEVHAQRLLALREELRQELRTLEGAPSVTQQGTLL
jgi:hypothetical protein